MHDNLERAALAAAEGGAPAKTFDVPETAEVRFSTTSQGHPFDGLVLAWWVE